MTSTTFIRFGSRGGQIGRIHWTNSEGNRWGKAWWCRQWSGSSWDGTIAGFREFAAAWLKTPRPSGQEFGRRSGEVFKQTLPNGSELVIREDSGKVEAMSLRGLSGSRAKVLIYDDVMKTDKP